MDTIAEYASVPIDLMHTNHIRYIVIFSLSFLYSSK